MHWDKKEIYEKYNYIQNLYNKEKKPLLKKDIYNDLCTLNAMKSLYDSAPFEIDEKQINDNYKHVNTPLLEKHISEIVIALNEYSIRIPNKKPRNVTILDYNSLLMEFFKEYHPKLIDIYNNLKQNNKIEINTNKKFEHNQCGECLLLSILNDLFVYCRYNGKILTSHYLPHELGHVYQAYCFDNIKEVADKRHSLFVEVYSTYVELLFINFLNKKGYHDQSKYLEKNYWYVFNVMIEQHFMFILNKDLFLNNINFQYIMSMLLSNIFYEDYLENNNHNSINDFNDIFINGNDKDIINEYTLKRILKSGKNAYERIL